MTANPNTEKTGSLEPVIRSKKILIICGSGGVGKTTAAAAIAMQGAMIGKKAIVLTIDPARRLATSMGLESLTDEPMRIQTDHFPASPLGSLDAMMLNTKRTFDRIIEKYAPSQEVAERILENRLYKHMSNMIAGSQEYMAMERLYEIYHEDSYDFIVLDTPPTRNALNFLYSPQKMVNLTRHSILKWFLKPGIFAGKVGFGILHKTADRILTVFDQLAGLSFLQELAEMVANMADMVGGFSDRAEKIYNLLRSKEISFILVTTPEKMALQDAQYFHEQIGQFKLPLAGFVLNRVYPEFITPELTLDEIQSRLKSLPTNVEKRLIDNLHDLYRLQKNHEDMISQFQKERGQDVFYIKVPILETDVHDMAGLAEINRYLFPLLG